MTQEQIEAAIALSKENLIDFCITTDNRFEPYWHHEELAKALERVERGELKRLIINMPPRHGKSMLTTEKFPTWYLGRHPEKEVVVAAYSAELAETFGFKSRDIMQSQAYKAIFGISLREDSKAKDHWMTSKGGGYRSVGFGGSLTGQGADLMILDDPIKNSEEAESQTFRDKQWAWYISTAYTRLHKGAPVVLILTRWHMDDLAGRLLKMEEEGGDHWEVINFPAIATQDEKFRKVGEPLCEDLFPLSELEQKRNVSGPYYWSAMYQQTPISAGNQEFKQDNFHYISEEEVLKKNTRRFMTIDTAVSKKASADYTGITLNFVDKEGMWNIMTWKRRFSPKELMDFIFQIWEKYNVEKIGIEKTMYLMALKEYFNDEMRKRGKFPHIVELQHNQMNKEARIRGILPYYESGTVWHIKGMCEGLEEELLTFPRGVHDDVCLIGDTGVLTKNGNVKIKHVNVGDYVLTRSGYKKVLWSGVTGIKDIITNIGITGTANHPVITTKGIKDLQYVNESDKLYIWNEKLLSIEERNFTDTQIQKEDNTEFISGDISKTTNLQFPCIGIFGLKRMVLYLKKCMSIIKMGILSIIPLKILKSYQHQNTQNTTQEQLNQETEQVSMLLKIIRECRKLLKSGEIQIKEKLGTQNTQKIRSTNQKKLSVLNVENQQLKIQEMQDSAQENVMGNFRPESLDGKIQVTIKRKVYNLKVEDAHEFFANGVLVHNCDSLAYQKFLVAKPNEENYKKVHVFKQTSFK
jgi:hypothetical protein